MISKVSWTQEEIAQGTEIYFPPHHLEQPKARAMPITRTSVKTAKRLEQLEANALTVIPSNERDADILRKRAARSKTAEVFVPAISDKAWERRVRLLNDPPAFLKYYFRDRYTRPFGKLHYKLMDSILEIAKHGGRKAVAAPRGRGKTEITKGMLNYLMLAAITVFPVPIGQTTDHARKIYEDFRRKVMVNERLAEDFPDVCYPVMALEGAPQRAGRQHVGGELTGIVWKTEELCLASLPEELRGPGADGNPIDYGKTRMQYRGLDGAIRGINVEGDRPDFVLIDDPETRESAQHQGQIDTRTNTLERDIAGLAGEDYYLSICMLTTIQNRFCLSWNYTDRKKKGAWQGERYGWVEQWPKHMDMWDDYIALRHKDQEEGDSYGKTATQFYLDNREKMELDFDLLSDNYKELVLEDGTVCVHSAYQEVFNAIADTSMDDFCTEYQNDPPAQEEIQQLTLTAAKVQSRILDTGKGAIPTGTQCVTLGIDLGKRACHWTAVAWDEEGCIGSIVEYGVVEIAGLNIESDAEAVEHAQLAALEVWAEEMLQEYNPLICLVDSGTFTDAAYEFCRSQGDPFYPAKGWDPGRFRLPPKQTEEKVPFLNAWAHWPINEQVWLYNVQTEWWKDWLQKRFLQQMKDEAGHRRDGSMGLYHHGGDLKLHLSFAHHMVSEFERWIPKEGKELVRDWYVKSRNNHWLDSTALACAAAGTVDIRLVQRSQQTLEQQLEQHGQSVERMKTRDGQNFLASQR